MSAITVSSPLRVIVYVVLTTGRRVVEAVPWSCLLQHLFCLGTGLAPLMSRDKSTEGSCFHKLIKPFKKRFWLLNASSNDLPLQHLPVCQRESAVCILAEGGGAEQ